MYRRSDSVFEEIPSPPASPHPAARAARLPAFVGLRCPPDAVLDGARLVVIGVGSVGRNLALHAARLQVGALYLVDPAAYKAESVLTQPIDPDEIGQPKASGTGRLCKRISPRTRVFALDDRVESLPESAFADADLVLAATDNLAAEVEVGQRCLHLGKPLVCVSVHGETMLTQVRFFGPTPEGPCPACGFNQAEWGHLNRETVFRCDGALSGRAVGRVAALPTMSVASVCGLGADLAFTEVLRHLLGLGESPQDTLVQYCGYTRQVVVARLVRNPACPCEHVRWTDTSSPRRLGDCSLRDLCASAGQDPAGAAGLAFRIDDWSFVELGQCARCGKVAPVQRLLAPGAPAGSCPACGGPVEALPFYTHRPIPAELVRPLMDRPLAALGRAGPRFVVVRGPERAALFRATFPEETTS